MFSQRDLRFALCSPDDDVLGAQRIVGFFILITHKSTGSENPIIRRTMVAEIDDAIMQEGYGLISL